MLGSCDVICITHVQRRRNHSNLIGLSPSSLNINIKPHKEFSSSLFRSILLFSNFLVGLKVSSVMLECKHQTNSLTLNSYEIRVQTGSGSVEKFKYLISCDFSLHFLTEPFSPLANVDCNDLHFSSSTFVCPF